ncbi:MAG: UDP-4-amino-4,6-dideoxy-N-acetyl-beta-L-altrosamine transaminase [Elusimicrobia bacterium]|nr:UDP-4-amino-4,6-dideoxy-N-acetyl-beta-L-altrosamine transaminase [Elusimicrobiota bacterium]
MKFLPYGRQTIGADDVRAVVSVLKSPWLTQGPKIAEFEAELCSRTGARCAVAVSNGTAALHLACLAAGLRKGMEVVTSPVTFVASANAVVYAGATPVFADIHPGTYTLDPGEVRRRLTARTKALVTVDFAGQAAGAEELWRLARSRGLTVIEDAAHAIGSRYRGGAPVGSCRFAHMTTFSFHPVKTVTTGEGGAVTTNSTELAAKLRLLRTHGITKEPRLLSRHPGPWYYEMQELGFNYRITDLQAALGLSQLRKLDRFVRRRREIVSMYNDAFRGVPRLTIPLEAEGLRSAFHLYVLQVDFKALGTTRGAFMEGLKGRGIGSQVLYIPVHLQPYYRERFRGRPGQYPRAEAFYERTLSLPLYPALTDADVRRVVRAVRCLVSREG